jgi:hypothetical protein
LNTFVSNWIIDKFNLQPVPTETGIHVASTVTMCAVIASYVFFVAYIRHQGLNPSAFKTSWHLPMGFKRLSFRPSHCSQLVLRSTASPAPAIKSVAT